MSNVGKRLLLLVIPMLLFGAMWGINWRRWHPPATPEDEQVRQLLASADRIKVVISQFDCWSPEGPACGHIPRYEGKLAPAEMQPVLNNLNLVHVVQSGPPVSDDTLLRFEFY